MTPYQNVILCETQIGKNSLRMLREHACHIFTNLITVNNLFQRSVGLEASCTNKECQERLRNFDLVHVRHTQIINSRHMPHTPSSQHGSTPHNDPSLWACLNTRPKTLQADFIPLYRRASLHHPRNCRLLTSHRLDRYP